MTGTPANPGQRIDRWLWCARFLKSRSLAASLVQSGRLRVNGERVSKASRTIRPDDVLTFPLGPHIRVVRILFLADRRGPAPEARLLYEDLDPPASSGKPERKEVTPPARDAGSGRPTKKERRQTDALRENDS
ncbi:RNA-binding S4 domain-containing protein [Parvibaculum sp.]|jgi:ribosome-associated heat shock protein Hsp15|uniref:RNA-binding S4 domain-containing protein n=1 Tax=Parvibaculum sp. TaxID=2024848 RepID=UPI000C58B00D|nr:RNA-binding S4 domain-containing protein [Parvibaculum sp.]MAU60788.1 RNA-binding protein S4 [Parvibaculum sp.]MBO6669041.1 RNA-binding S4 domain-containing protein [Parvibaculum sp.]MBO6691822.1 RNA-binding S4 domain-containing protein [Parvibaculum sp.]MBO6715823.1 RNA-binding S4 domain-containing protein [Parvibaculum sp.]